MAAPTVWDAYIEQGLQEFVDSGSLRKQLTAAEGDVFHREKSNVAIHDVSETGTVVSYKVVTDTDLQVAEQARPSSGTRSIYSDRTIAPLKATPSIVSAILASYAVRSEFLPVLLSFGDEPHQSEASSSNFVYASADEDEYVISYKLNFVEENQRGGPDTWSFRHVGIYHHHKKGLDIFIIVHCTRDTAFYKRMAALLPSSPPTGEGPAAASSLLVRIRDQPESLHNLLLSCYSGNWRPYLRYLGKIFADRNDKAMVDNAEATRQASFTAVQALRNTNDFALFANACCSNNVDILERLSKCQRFSEPTRQRTESQALVLRGHIASCKVLQDRMSNTIELVGYTLTLHNQLETGKLDKEIRDMTRKLQDLSQKSVDDSTIVRLITILSAIYLPGSFVGGIFGMNFFVFDTDQRKIVIAYDFWIFILVWLGLSALTGLVFLWTWWRKEQEKKTYVEDGAKEK